ncbi:hypothetical protein AGDE_02667 [Angomonas deanei]|uniref:Alpha/beta hydrolase family n=1 Tax=Angomonas deanei TaxID=59799 RepID=A0A7G2CEL2_9TRYP|nr:hypothetical protein AGDE_02667 [Angomonas deanei]CAD2218310.1 hypothetical protein, conserved [Angomonas deanei]|eukprot:EPY41258.1 hypothetical protein AGDE_02667 [Angomonas deanei]
MSAKYTDDLRSVVRGVLSKKALSERFNKEVTLFAAGFSLGGVILSKFVGEECLNKEAFNIQCVLVVNSPLDAVKANDVMDRPINRVLYQPHMSKGLVRYALRHRHLLKDIPLLPPHVQQCFANGNYDEIFKQVKSVSDFDAVINAPANGYDNPIEYYKDITPLKWIPHITVPVLCISAADDPTCGTFPFEPFRRMMDRSDNIGYILFPHGGHLGYVGSPLKEWRGLPNMLEETLCTIIHSYNAA